MLDGIFSPLFFKNEIIWKRTTAHSNVYSNYGDVTDSIFFYVKSDSYTWNQLRLAIGFVFACASARFATVAVADEFLEGNVAQQKTFSPMH